MSFFYCDGFWTFHCMGESLWESDVITDIMGAWKRGIFKTQKKKSVSRVNGLLDFSGDTE